MRNLDLAWNPNSLCTWFLPKRRMYIISTYSYFSQFPTSRFLSPSPTTEDRILFRSSLLFSLHFTLLSRYFPLSNYSLCSCGPPFDDRPIFLFFIGFLILFMIYAYFLSDRLFVEFFLMGLSYNLNSLFCFYCSVWLYSLFFNGYIGWVVYVLDDDDQLGLVFMFWWYLVPSSFKERILVFRGDPEKEKVNLVRWVGYFDQRLWHLINFLLFQ